MKSLLSMLALVLIFSLPGIAQDSTRTETSPPAPKQTKEQKIYYGGNMGLTVGTYTRIGVYPLIAYKITPKLSVGLKFAYEYIRDNRYDGTYQTSNYGASIFSRYRIIPPIYVHVEYAQLNYELYNAIGESNREWVPFLLVGGGYSQRLSPNTWLNIEVLFDVLQDERSPYTAWNPIFSVGVGVGF
jgi:hypothetical protein